MHSGWLRALQTCSVALCLAVTPACSTPKHLSVPPRPDAAITGSAFFKSVFDVDWTQREALAKKEILAGNVPAFLRSFVAVNTSITTAEGGRIDAVYFVLPDYLSIGTDDDFARIPLTPMAAQVIADSLRCFLPTRKMVDEVYRAATVKLEPVPMYALRDSAVTMYHDVVRVGATSAVPIALRGTPRSLRRTYHIPVRRGCQTIF